MNRSRVIKKIEEREPNLADWKHEEGTATAHFDDDGYELWVDSTQRAVPGHTGDPHVVNAMLWPPCLAEDVTELALPDEGHV